MADEYRFVVNGVEHTTTEQKSMLRYLRDDLGLLSVKDGCSEGACGACTVLVDGKAMKSCVLNTKCANGKEITTVEGLTHEEKEAFVYAFGARGAVQCGFCTPGMVMSGVALLRKNSNPTEQDIKKAINGNICRCTGYKKIIEGIDLAGKALRGEEKLDYELEKGDKYGVGVPAFRNDVREKVLGYGKFPDDVTVKDYPDMAYGSCVRTKYPRAKVLKIDTTKAEALSGVVGVLRAEDVPVNQVGHLIRDWDVFIAEGDITRSMGDALCMVVAETPEILERAKKLVDVEYEELDPVRNIDEAAKPDAPLIHTSFNAFGNHVVLHNNICQQRHITRGDTKEALRNSAYTVTGTFETPFTEHAFLEPECAVAFPYKNGVKILSTDQGAYDTRQEVAHMFGWDKTPERVVVQTMLVGGGYGGKEDVSVQHLAALAAFHFNRTVKVKLTRQESINFHPKRHAMRCTYTLGCDKAGLFTGLDADIHFDTGAYASLCGPVLERACTHSVGPYKYQNTDIRGYGYYTNNPPAGAFRGFGVCQTEFALESLIDELADKAGIDRWKIRYNNAIEPGAVLPNGQIADRSTALKETLLAIRDEYEKNKDHAGLACAMKNSGVGVGLPDAGRANIHVENGKAVIYSATSDIGQGCNTIFMQDLSEATGLPREAIRSGECSTEAAPDSGTTSGSRQTVITGEAVRGAAFLLRDAMEKVECGEEVPKGKVSAKGDGIHMTFADGTTYTISDPKTLKAGHTQTVKDPEGALKKLEGCQFAYEYFEPTDKLGAHKKYPKSHICYAYSTTLAVLDENRKVSNIYAAHDSGKVINPIAIQGQIEGGVLMSMGYALTENFVLKDCVPKVKYGTLGLPHATQIPNIHAIYVEKDELLPVAYGGKGIGEISSIGAAPAIRNAYRQVDGVGQNRLPLDGTPYKHR